MTKHNSELAEKISSQAHRARAAILQMTTLSGSGHPGGSMSSIDLLLSLYNTIRHDPQNPALPDRDRVIVSIGHISPGVYSALGTMGYFTLDDAIAQFRVYGSKFDGHIERDVPGVEWSTGNLGQGLSAAVGMAMASRIKGIDNFTYTLMGDGEQQKGQISEARRFAAKYKLHNLIAIVDYNQIQISGSIHEVMPQNIRKNWEADGWQVMEVNGHDIAQILSTLDAAREADAPVMILAHTVMGKGVSFMENKAKYHGSTLNDEQCIAALNELGLPSRLTEYRKLREDFVNKKQVHASTNMAARYDLSPSKPILYDSDSDCRSAWGNAIADLAKANLSSPNPIVVVDCDLATSVKTTDFEAVSPERFLQVGIMEHHAAVMSGAISIAGIQCFWADFGVFGIDETYNMQRLNDINHANLKTVLTHVGIDVGADGKTHQCVDYISMVRNLFNTRIICPADANQTDRVIRWLIDKPGNYVVSMGRSKLPLIRNTESKPYYDLEYSFEYGKADLIREGNHGTVFVCGTPAGRTLKAIDTLREEGTYLQLIYVSSPLQIDQALIADAARLGTIFSVEDHSVNGGLGSSIAEAIVAGGLKAKLVKIGVEAYPRSGDSEVLFTALGMNSAALCERFRKDI